MNLNPVAISSYLTMAVLFLQFGLSRDAAALLLAGQRSSSRNAFIMARGGEQNLRKSDRDAYETIPKDPRTCLAALDLRPHTRKFICCPKCFALYEDDPSAPDTCQRKPIPIPVGVPCGAKLWRKRTVLGSQRRFPALQYLHQDLQHWIARLLSRPGIEDLLEQQPVAGTDTVSDIWEASEIRDFLGPDGLPFICPGIPNDELRLLFSFNADGFNPYQSKDSRISASSTGIYMVCLNLPKDLRYRPENMYLAGVIPGKPSEDEINDYIGLVVDDLLAFWASGVFFSRTAKFRRGRLTRSALIPIVSDMLAARQLGGFGSHAFHLFCHLCFLDSADIENLDPSTWPPRTNANHRYWATKWRDAQSMEERDAIFKEHGVRWSEFLRLTYWDAVRYIVIDSMHAMYLMLYRNHCRVVWGMNITLEDDDEGNLNPDSTRFPPQSKGDMERAATALKEGDRGRLAALRKSVLFTLAEYHGVRRAGTKKQITDALLTWVCTLSFDMLAAYSQFTCRSET